MHLALPVGGSVARAPDPKSKDPFGTIENRDILPRY